MPAIPVEEFEMFADGLDHPESIAFDCNGNLWAGGEAGQVYHHALPTNLAFAVDGSDYVYFANLGRWHVCRARARVQGMPLAGTRDGASR